MRAAGLAHTAAQVGVAQEADDRGRESAGVVGVDRPPVGAELPGAEPDDADRPAESLDPPFLHVSILAGRAAAGLSGRIRP